MPLATILSKSMSTTQVMANASVSEAILMTTKMAGTSSFATEVSTAMTAARTSGYIYV